MSRGPAACHLPFPKPPYVFAQTDRRWGRFKYARPNELICVEEGPFDVDGPLRPPVAFLDWLESVGMELSDHTTITILRAAWVIDVAAVLILHWTALALLRYLDGHPSAVGSAADDLPAPESRSWMWRTAGGGRLLRFVWSAAAIRARDSTVRQYVWVLRVASAAIAASLIAMLLATARHPSRHWSIVQNEQRQAAFCGNDVSCPSALTRPAPFRRRHPCACASAA
jgi:hypothetical protein